MFVVAEQVQFAKQFQGKLAIAKIFTVSKFFIDLNAPQKALLRILILIHFHDQNIAL